MHVCVFVCMIVTPRAGSLAESGFGFSCWWCVLFVCVCNLCVRVCKGVLDHSEIRDCAARYIASRLQFSALGQIYWPSNHGSQ